MITTRRSSPEWIREYATKSASMKICANADRTPPQDLLDTVETAFSRVYRAVAFDIDGTLTKQDSSIIAPEAAEAVGALLKRGVHVFLVTGRGETSTREAALSIRKHAKLTDWYLRRLSCIVLNGVLLLTTNSEYPEQFLQLQELLCPDIPFLKDILRTLSRKIESSVPGATRIEPKTNSIRIVIEDDTCIDAVRRIILECIHKKPLNPPLHLSVGRYAKTISFSVASTDKKTALALLAKKYGISEDHILRIGDQGHKEGNDYELLDSPAGFSVGSISRSTSGCLPVLDDSFAPICQAAKATRRLMSRLYLFPSISMSPKWTETHTRTLLTFEKLALRRSREENETVTQRLRVRLRYLVGPTTNHGPTIHLRIDDLFDPLSGAVRFRDWEFSELPSSHPAVTFFRERSPICKEDDCQPGLTWSMHSDTGLLLRGPNYYYSLSCTRKEPKLDQYLSIVSYLLESCIKSIDAFRNDEPSLPLFKLLLGLADNLRNSFIILQYACFMGDLQSPTNNDFNITRQFFYEIMSVHTKHHLTLLLSPDWTWRRGLTDYHNLLLKIKSRLEILIKPVISSLESMDDQTEVIRRWRESDHFLQNVTAVQLGLHEFQQRADFAEDSIIMCGLLYGGTELPAIAKAVGEARGMQVSTAFAKLSLYGEREDGEKVRQGDVAYVEEYLLKNNRLCIMDDSQLNSKVTFLLDDNITTGATLQLARDLIIVHGGDVGGAITVGFPGSNRIAQMAMEGHGLVDPDLLFGFIRGLIVSSPYSRLLFPGEGDDPYLDQTGIFNKARTRIERYLYKNHRELAPPWKG